MNKEQLDKITEDLIINVFRNSEILMNEGYMLYDHKNYYDLLDVIASLHNLLYEIVTGQRYDYMFHWTNKEGYNGIVDNIYDEVIKNV